MHAIIRLSRGRVLGLLALVRRAAVCCNDFQRGCIGFTSESFRAGCSAEHPDTIRIDLLTGVCIREASARLMPHHSTPQVTALMMHILIDPMQTPSDIPMGPIRTCMHELSVS